VIIKFRNIFFILALFFQSCSFYDTAGIWSSDEKIKIDEIRPKPLFKDNKVEISEFNKDVFLNFEGVQKSLNQNQFFDNNDGLVENINSVEKFSKYKLSKNKNLRLSEPDLIFDANHLIFFDNKGNLLKFDENKELKWKINIYNKNEKKIEPILFMEKKDGFLYVADNLSKIYKINIDNGSLMWVVDYKSPFNSEIKIYSNKIYVVDANNTMNCFSTLDGKKIWSYNTEETFIRSSKRSSVVIYKENVIFNNSFGDIYALNLDDGILEWQLSTNKKSNNITDSIDLEYSDLTYQNDSIYVSNNKGNFYSIDIDSGLIKWTQNIKSKVKPLIVEDWIITFSDNGYLTILDSKKGNILKIVDISKNIKIKRKEVFKISGFISNLNKIYATSNLGHLLEIDLNSGKLEKIIKISKNYLSRPFYKNGNIYLVLDGAIIQFN